MTIISTCVQYCIGHACMRALSRLTGDEPVLKASLPSFLCHTLLYNVLCYAEHVLGGFLF